MGRAVCIVSPGNLASNPRVLKEADALHEADYAVTAVVCDYTEALRPFDDEIVGRVPWKVVRVARPAGERQVGKAARALARLATSLGMRVPVAVAALAYGGPVAALRRAASEVPADLYIAHYVAGLAAAADAARRSGAMLGFDAEDYHAGEGTPFDMSMVRTIESALLPACRHVTAAAPLIAKAYAAQCRVEPTTVLNVFSLAMAPMQARPTAGRDTFKAYWFSQTIGLDRGLQSFILAMAKTRTHVTLDIRGGNRWGHGEQLVELARGLGIGDRISLLPMARPEEMARLAAAYDIGLSLETDVSENRRLCLTNKVFTYLLAGVPVLLSDTPAQRALAPDLGAAQRLVSLADPAAMAATLDDLAGSPVARAEASASAWKLGRERYNWEVEKAALLGSVARAFASRQVTP
ncbi:Glycosyl transferases group 1 [Rhodospirillales bacterium URHD0017]|nr:Glycosyl transferases group 1 [Rhodospirillales bacterium URHD0017]